MNFKEYRTYLAVFSCYIGATSIIFIVGFPSPTQKELINKNIITFQTLPIFASISHLTRIIGLMTAPIKDFNRIELYYWSNRAYYDYIG